MTPVEIVERRSRNGALIHVLRSRPGLTPDDRRFLNLLSDQDGKVSNNQFLRLSEMMKRYKVSFAEYRENSADVS